MTASPFDTIVLESVEEDKSLDILTSVQMKNSINGPSEATFELGDDGTYPELEDFLALGQTFRVTVNDYARLTGRVEMLDTPLDAGRSSVLRFAIRTRLTDAVYASADPKIRVKNVSIKEFVLACYATIGVTPDKFVFDPATARQLLTGKPAKGARSPKDLAPLKEDQAKVRPPESVFTAVDRHLRRHGLMHWDSPDGKIIVGQPDDEQAPIYQFRSLRGSAAQDNNVLSVTRVRDVGDSPTLLGVFGQGGGRNFSKTKIRAIEVQQTLLDAGFNRPVLLVDEGIKTQELAERRARREVAMRTRGLDGFTVSVDGFSHDPAGRRGLYAPDTVAEVVFETSGRAFGSYYVEATQMAQSPGGGQTTQLTLVQPGVWRL